MNTIEGGSGVSGAAPNPGSRWYRLRRRIGEYFYLLPAFAIVVGIVYYSIGYTIWLSTLDWDGLSPNARFIGFGNYLQAFTDPVFWATLWHTALFSLVILIQMALGFFFALALHSRIVMAPVYKVILFLPVVLSPAVMAPVFRRIFDAGGSLNQFLGMIGLDGLTHAWLADPATSLYVLMVVNIWQWTGFSFMLYYASLTQIDQDILEAGRIDGTNNWTSIRHIILPMMSGTHFTLAILGVIGAFKTFDIIILITNGGPARASEFLSSYIYKQAILQFDMGYAGALSILLLIISLAIAVYQSTRQRRSHDV